MAESAPLTFLCLAGYEKGHEFLRELKRQGQRVILITASNLQEADWPRESLDDIFFLPDMYDLNAMINGVSYLARTHRFDRIVAIDDFDVETAAALREHFQMPGLGTTVARRFRDKLAMRATARNAGLPVPDFIQVANYEALSEWMARVPPPWVLKPRGEAAASGITVIHSPDEFWPRLEPLGDRQSLHLLEKYLPGEVFHVDSVVYRGKVRLAEVHQYGRPPLDIMQGGGGVFVTRRVRRGSEDEATLRDLNERVIKALGLTNGVTHAEYIKGRDDGRCYFLEIACRVGGANIAEAVEAATGINPWREWARIEIDGGTGDYKLPKVRQDHAGVVVSLARQEWPDSSQFGDPEIVYRIEKRHHIGFVLASPDHDRVRALLDDYAGRIARDYSTTIAAPDRLRIAADQR
jgi:carbamoylphosphate synthase large subunit